MKRVQTGLLAAAALVAMGSGSAEAVAIKEIFALTQSTDNIMRIDLNGPMIHDMGAHGKGFMTNLAMAPDRTLYFMGPFEAHELFSAQHDVNFDLINITSLGFLPTAGFGIIDGFTVGPDGHLYMTGYGKSEIYRYHLTGPNVGTFETAVRLVAPPGGGPAGEFRSDLAFDPITNNLVGLGIEPGSTDRTLFEIPLADVLNGGLGINPVTDYVWSYFGGNVSAWSTKMLDTGSELGGNPDGIAFDPTNGDLYMSGDGTGIYEYNRSTAVRGALIPGTGDGFLNGFGFDLAFQTRDVPIGTVVPEPFSAALVVMSGGALVARLMGRAKRVK